MLERGARERDCGLQSQLINNTGSARYAWIQLSVQRMYDDYT